MTWGMSDGESMMAPRGDQPRPSQSSRQPRTRRPVVLHTASWKSGTFLYRSPGCFL